VARVYLRRRDNAEMRRQQEQQRQQMAERMAAPLEELRAADPKRKRQASRRQGVALLAALGKSEE
jgi:hypothetical protein